MTDKIKTLIIDDEKLARDIIKNYLKNRDDIEISGEAGNGFEAIKLIQELKPALIFLDIQMPKITGFEMLELIDDPPVIIFTTAYDQYALKAFEVNATDYLLKPFALDRFNEAIEKAKVHLQNKSEYISGITKLTNNIQENTEYLNRLIVKKNQSVIIIPIDNIHFIEAQDDYVMIHSEEGKNLKQKTMKALENSLDPNEFIRIHRSYIVNIRQIQKLEAAEKESYVVKLKDGNILPVSKSGYSRLKELLK